MSMHKKPLTELEHAGLKAHGLDIGTPSQLSDVFRQGIAFALANAPTVQREGWVSVPIVLTDEMHDAFSETVCFEFDETGAAITNLEQCYKAMLAAAPSDGTKQLNTKG